MRTSDENVLESDGEERISVSYPHIRSLNINVTVSYANWRNWWNKGYD